VVRRRCAAAQRPETGGARRHFAGSSPEKAFSSYNAPFTTRFGPRGREERREAHLGVVGGGGTPERTCAKEWQTGSRALAGEVIAASVACYLASGRDLGVSVRASEEEVRESR
jgi:hypothetical protein